jgi:hypothetical protein
MVRAGGPKCCKSFLALDLAVAVAGGVPCLRRFAVPRAGRVPLFAAEDALHIVRRRLEDSQYGVGQTRDSGHHPPTLRLDLDADRRNLAATVARLQPRLLNPRSVRMSPPPARSHRGGGVRAGQALRGTSEFGM